MSAADCIECNVLHRDALQVLENGEGSVNTRCSALHIVIDSALPISAESLRVGEGCAKMAVIKCQELF